MGFECRTWHIFLVRQLRDMCNFGMGKSGSYYIEWRGPQMQATASFPRDSWSHVNKWMEYKDLVGFAVLRVARWCTWLWSGIFFQQSDQISSIKIVMRINLNILTIVSFLQCLLFILAIGIAASLEESAWCTNGFDFVSALLRIRFLCRKYWVSVHFCASHPLYAFHPVGWKVSVVVIFSVVYYIDCVMNCWVG